MEVIWDDAVSNDGWVDVNNVEPIPRVVTRGWLVRKDEHSLTLANSIFENNSEVVGGTQSVPCGMIVSSRVLKVNNFVQRKNLVSPKQRTTKNSNAENT